MEVVRGGDYLEARALPDNVFGPAVGRGQGELVLVRGIGDEDDALALEEPRDRSRLPE